LTRGNLWINYGKQDGCIQIGGGFFPWIQPPGQLTALSRDEHLFWSATELPERPIRLNSGKNHNLKAR